MRTCHFRLAIGAMVGLLLLLLLLQTPPVEAAQGPTEDSFWYYEIGGAQPVSPPPNPLVTSVTLG